MAQKGVGEKGRDEEQSDRDEVQWMRHLAVALTLAFASNVA